MREQFCYIQSVLRIRDVYPGSRILIFTHPGSRIQKQQQKRGVKKFFLLSYLVFELPKKKIWAYFQRILELFMQKIVIKLSKIWFWDPGSEIRDPRSGIRDPGSGKNPFQISDPGSRGKKGNGSRIRIRNTAYSTLESI